MNPNVWIDVPYIRFPFKGICTGGRPRPHHIHQAQAGGIKSIIDLCAPSERNDFDEGDLVRTLGMRYRTIPVAGPPDLNLKNAQALADALEEAQDGPIFVHCASGNRVGALFALKARFVDRLAVEQCLVAGRSAGLTSLESEVSFILAGL
jgi:protein tyrosine phosphatase (PTP) superfamily phosphohydrolase (DUF442 family)